MDNSILYSAGISIFLSGLSYGILQSRNYVNTRSIDRLKTKYASMTTEIKAISVDLGKAEANLEENYKKVEKLDSKLDLVLKGLNELNVKVAAFIGNKK